MGKEALNVGIGVEKHGIGNGDVDVETIGLTKAGIGNGNTVEGKEKVGTDDGGAEETSGGGVGNGGGLEETDGVGRPG